MKRAVSGIFGGREAGTAFLTLPVNITYHTDAKRWGVTAQPPCDDNPKTIISVQEGAV